MATVININDIVISSSEHNEIYQIVASLRLEKKNFPNMTQNIWMASNGSKIEFNGNIWEIISKDYSRGTLEAVRYIDAENTGVSFEHETNSLE